MDANQFRYRMSQLPEPLTDKAPPYWEAWRLDLWRRAQSQAPTRFWEWPCIYHTMMQEHWPNSISYEFSEMPFYMSSEKMNTAFHIPHFGPDDELGNSGYSKNLIHQFYHLRQWMNVTGQHISQLDTIVEFGGGYGAMALLCHRLGFEGKYIIYDLPEFSLLQEYYLSQFGLLASVEWNPKRQPKGVDLFMAMYSLSEVPLLERAELRVRAKSYLFLYSGNWEGWDNVMYFQMLLPSLPGVDKFVTWRHTELTHLPDKNNFYSIGW